MWAHVPKRPVVPTGALPRNGNHRLHVGHLRGRDSVIARTSRFRQGRWLPFWHGRSSRVPWPPMTNETAEDMSGQKPRDWPRDRLGGWPARALAVLAAAATLALLGLEISTTAESSRDAAALPVPHTLLARALLSVGLSPLSPPWVPGSALALPSPSDHLEHAGATHRCARFASPRRYP